MKPAELGGRSVWRHFAQAVQGFNVLTGYLSGITIVVASIVVCYGVLMRYYFHSSIGWMLEMSIFLLVIATFMSAGYTQLLRGHVTIEVLEHILSSRANKWRYLVGDILSLAFCAFLAWNAWEFFHEAYVDGRVTNSTWGPKLWIPYSFMFIGTSALSLQLLVQIVDTLIAWKRNGVHQPVTAPEWQE
jgi:TRAP-type C4-dicarboxylate transport system permease small subunit